MSTGLTFGPVQVVKLASNGAPALQLALAPIIIGAGGLGTFVLVIGLIYVVTAKVFAGRRHFAELFLLSSAAYCPFAALSGLIAGAALIAPPLGYLHTVTLLGALGFVTYATSVAQAINWWKAAAAVVPIFLTFRLIGLLFS